MAARCEAVQEHQQEQLAAVEECFAEKLQEREQERDAKQLRQQQIITALEDRVAQVGRMFQRSEDNFIELIQASNRRLAEVSEERDAFRDRARAFEERLEEMADHRGEDQESYRQWLEERAAAHHEQHEALLAEQAAGVGLLHEERLQAAEERLQQCADAHREALSDSVAEHRELLTQAHSSHREQINQVEVEMAQRAHSYASEAAQEASRHHCRAAQEHLAEFHRSLQCQAEDEHRLRLDQLAEQSGGVRAQQLQLSAQPDRGYQLPGGADGPERRPPAETALRDRLRQLAAIEEKMRLAGGRSTRTVGGRIKKPKEYTLATPVEPPGTPSSPSSASGVHEPQQEPSASGSVEPAATAFNAAPEKE